MKLRWTQKRLLRRIQEDGYITRDINRGWHFANGRWIRSERINRLVELGVLIPKGDALFDGPSQTYVVSDDACASVSLETYGL